MKKEITKAKLKNRQKKQLAALTGIILVASFIAVLMLTPVFDINEISVKGNSVIKTEDIIRNSGIVKGVNIFGISIGESEQNIKEIGYVEQVKIKRRLPGRIEIEIVEAAGVACVAAKNGYVVINAEGRCIEFLDFEKVSSDKDLISGNNRIPLIKGLKNVKYKIGKKITTSEKHRLETLISCLKAFSKHSFIFDMTEINVSNLSGITFKYNGGKLDVKMGDAENLEYKMEVFGAVLNKIGKNAEGYVDLKRQVYGKNEKNAE